ncbi:fructose bisphosphate aldolase [Pseudohalocynthiibacter aestuariivivens]|jgi:fructose-bisphosphate aldolase, class I|uniref:fructose-bisphosphate aldolase n=1 Tax=Pseudohalocynthiibacter aestuariivivens TaxID=1591409 RepID=A0ABV5JKW7_9RHOB|nr:MULTISPECIES: fructose bisphosphate aldolase [Pseudohalocynthiibacter]MBS9716573.1 fructose bisphosphate aldolase [Pseudohalocynthiibacter aestuariivivens]MCK0101643.1 fructose bisphosphate aldolase [Pseudohalocynthiibacter sp. F2068]
MPNQEQLNQIRKGKGFVAALDQSGGSTPKALRLYGINEDAYSSDAEMFDLMHAMRKRIAKAPAFTGDKIVGAILFEMTMDREIDGKPTATYMWEDRYVVPFLKVDKGLNEEENGVQLMKPMPELDALLKRAVDAGIFGTKMRSVINAANREGIKAIVAQQFNIGKQILKHGLIPIIEPEVNITITDKAEAEEMLLAELTAQLDALPDGQEVMLKLTLPETANQYKSLVDHPRILRIVALSGGYSRDEANDRLSQNAGVIASFSRALTEGLSANQSDEDFNATIAATINSIYEASIAG